MRQQRRSSPFQAAAAGGEQRGGGASGSHAWARSAGAVRGWGRAVVVTRLRDGGDARAGERRRHSRVPAAVGPGGGEARRCKHQWGRAALVRALGWRGASRAGRAAYSGGGRVGRWRHGRVPASVMQKLKGKEAHE